MRMQTLSCLISCVLTLAACSPATQPPVAPSAATTAEKSHVPSKANMDRFLKEGPEPTLQALRPLDFWLQYKMMQANGIEQALGGEAQTIAAMKALGDAYERKLRNAEAEAPKMIPATFTGEGMSSGMAGLGMGAFAGIISGGMLSGAVSSMSDETLGQLVKAGPIKLDDKSGSFVLQFGEDGSLTQSLAFDVNESGLNGKVKIRIQVDACPDLHGKVTVHLDVDSSMNVSGKPGTGGHVHTQFDYERYLDDDAHLSSGNDGGASNLRIQAGGSENFEHQQFDVSSGHERGGKATFTNHGGLQIFRPEEVARFQEMVQAAEFLNTVVAESMLRGVGLSAGSPWESGHCVKLDVTSDPGKRKGIRPNTAFDIEAKPRAKADGAPTGGTVTASLDGGSSLQPGSGKVPADAKYQYAGPDKKDQTASIQFEARSKRGVGKATLQFDTKAVRAYHADGGLDEFHGAGTICDLSKNFTISGSGNTVTFSPSDEQGGTYSYAGNMRGFAVSGKGTYTATANEHGGKIIGTGTGCVKTPMGTRCNGGTEHYKLTPIDACTSQ